MLVTGPAWIFVGVPLWAVGLIAVPAPNANLSQRKPGGSPGTGAVFNDQGEIIGGTLENNQRPPPPEVAAYFAGWVPMFLGSAKVSPRISHEPAFVPWQDDEFSTQLPADELYDGEQATVICDSTRWNEPVYRWITTRVKPLPLGGRAGFDFAGAVGTSMTHELQDYPLWVQFSLSAKAVHRLRGHVPGYRYWQARLVTPDEMDDLGHMPMRRRLIWRCHRYHDLASGAAILYDHDFTNPTLPRVN